jgi:signal transduction histidine kinase
MIKSIRLKILLIIIVFLVILFSGFFYFMILQLNEETGLNDEEAVTESKKTFDNLAEEETRVLKMGLMDTMENNDIKNLFLEKDRQKLYDYVKPLFDSKQEELGLTHWLFHEPDRNVFLRVHSPDVFGMPTQERKTFTRAEQSKSWGIGMELGAVGFALRVVHPYYKDNGLIGYMEYGEDISPLLQRMKNQTGNNVAMVAKKTSVNAEQWRSFRESLGLRNNYDDMQNFVMLGATDEKLVDAKNKCFTEQSLENIPENGAVFNNFKLDDRNYSCGGFAMTDTNSEKTGAVIVTRDITAEIATANRTKYTIFVISFFSTLLFSFIIIMILNKIIVRPLRKLTAAANEIERGDLSETIPVESQDEIGILATAFNEMRKRLKHSYEFLEETVKQKTCKLSDALEETGRRNTSLENSKRAMLNILEDFEESKKIIEKEKNRYELERDRSEGVLGYLRAISESIVATNSQKEITFVNQTASKIVCSEDRCQTFIGKNYLDVFNFFTKEGGKDIPIDPVLEVISRRGVFDLFHNSFLMVSSKKIPVSGSFAPIMKEGKILGAVGIFQDVTELRRLEKEKDNFISVAAHQLRTPLSGIRWMIEMLLDGDAGEISGEAKEILQEISENNQRLAILVNDLLDVSKINMGKTKEDQILIDVFEEVGKAEKALDGLVKERKINMTVEKLCAENPKVKIGPIHFYQSLENLISNAIKYTPAGGNVKITVGLKKEKAIIAVSDTGIGIPEKEQEKVFGKFFRASNAVLKETEGSGLGLNVVKSYVEEASGRIWFESEEGKGTTFFVELPIAE